MTVTIFLDILILENFIVNFFLLYITLQTIKMKPKIRYLVLGALVGALYVICLVYPSLRLFASFPFKIIVALMMIVISLRSLNVKANLWALVIFILYSMMLAGVCFFIETSNFSDTYFQAEILKQGLMNFSYKTNLLAMMIIYIILHRTVIYIKDRKQLSTLIYEVDIGFNNSVRRVRAFLDTGNELREPATNLPVIIVERGSLGKINIKESEKFLISYSVVDGTQGKMEGFKPDKVQLSSGGNKVDTEAIVAFCDSKLSKENEYEALLSRGIFF